MLNDSWCIINVPASLFEAYEFTEGTLNEVLNDQFEVETEGKVIVFRAY